MANSEAQFSPQAGRWSWNGLSSGDDEASESQSTSGELLNPSTNTNPHEVHRYEPLDKSVKSSFRLATLLPGLLHSQPRVTLSNSTLENQSVSYEALSYVWGDQSSRRTINLDGSDFEVTESLYHALNHVRSRWRPRVLWIDAICIDQTNIQERNHQVASMAEIYESCQRVIVWLGDEHEKTGFLATFIGDVIQDMKERLPDGKDLLTSRGISNLYHDEMRAEFIDVIFRADRIAGWRSFFRILGSRWWERAWVVQEFATAPDAIFCVGRFSFDWMSICALLIFLDTGRRSPRISHLRLDENNPGLVEKAMSVYFNRLTWQHKRLNQSSQESSSQSASYFLTLLHDQCARHCGDSRDKVYSILSMAGPEIQQELHPDYSKSARSVYIATVKAYINAFKNLNILGCNTYVPFSDSGYPSWCPDWSKNQVRSNVDVDFFRASAMTAAEATLSEDESTLHITGFHVTTVKDHCIQGAAAFRNNWAISDWDLRHMARKIHHASGYEKTGSPKAEYDNSAIILAETLVAGRCQNSIGQNVECPPVTSNEANGEWWLGDDKRRFISIASSRTFDKTVILCDDMSVGLAPRHIRVEDEIWIFLGAATPFIVRRMDGGVNTIIGNCFVHGIMKGEAMGGLNDGRYRLTQLSLR
jgi:hypothetical protein